MAQAVERVGSSAEENQRELVAKLAQLTERVERIERQSVTTATPGEDAADRAADPGNIDKAGRQTCLETRVRAQGENRCSADLA